MELFFTTLGWWTYDPMHLSGPIQLHRASLVAQMVKNLHPMQETRVQSLGWEDPLEKEWQPTRIFWPGELHGQRSLAGYSPRHRKELDTTVWLSNTHIQLYHKQWNKLLCNIYKKLTRVISGSQDDLKTIRKESIGDTTSLQCVGERSWSK